MNIVLADVQSLKVNLAEAGVETELPDKNLDDGEFSNLLEKQMTQDAELSTGVEKTQAVDFKELNINLDALVEFDAAVLEGADIPAPWLDYLSAEGISVTTESEQAIVIPDMLPNEIPRATETGDIEASIAVAAIGEELPANGNALPPGIAATGLASTTAVPAMASEKSVEVPPVVQSVIRQLAGQTEVEADTVASERQVDLKNADLPSVLRQNEAGLSLKPSVPGETAAIRNVEFQSVQTTVSEVLDTGSQQRLQNVGLGLQAPTTTQNTTLLPTALETLTVSNSRDTGAWASGIGDRVQWMINQKLNTATIRLDPPMLGRLDVHIQVSDDVTNVTINTQHAQTRDIIENASFRLRDYLQENGYQNVNVDVSQHEQQQQASQETGDGVADSAGDDVSTQEFVDNDASQTAQYYSSESVVDFFA